MAPMLHVNQSNQQLFKSQNVLEGIEVSSFPGLCAEKKSTQNDTHVYPAGFVETSPTLRVRKMLVTKKTRPLSEP